MNRFTACFRQKVFAAYLTAGDGETEEAFLALLRGGANLLEIGIPYSDPVADGPVIQQAMERALKAGATLQTALDLAASLRKKTDAPLVFFTYFNPIQRRLRSFLQDAKQAGVDGILVVDLPLEETDIYRTLCLEIGLAPIFVVAPSTPDERIETLSRAGSGFLYYACRKGTTGERSSLPPDVRAKLRSIKQRSKLPVVAGFGIAARADAALILEEADGFVVGSHFVRALARGAKPEELERMCHDLRP